MQEYDGDYPQEAWIAFADNAGEEYAAIEGFEESYAGEYDSEQDYAMELADDMGVLANIEGQSWPMAYIDWASATRDLFIDDMWSTRAPSGGVFVFYNI